MEPSVERREPIGGGLFVLVSDKHRFTSDPVLLAHFAAPKPNDRICDLGTGCGIIPMLFIKNGVKNEIIGVDIQADAVELCRRTAGQNGVKFTAVSADIANIKTALPRGAFSLVTCNSPYFAKNSGKQSREKSDATARHETDCTIDDVAAASAYLLKNSGRLCICHRPERLCDVFAAMRAHGIEPKRLRLVHERPSAKPSIALIEGRLGGGRGLDILPPFFVREGEDYSPESKAIYAGLEG